MKIRTGYLAGFTMKEFEELNYLASTLAEDRFRKPDNDYDRQFAAELRAKLEYLHNKRESRGKKRRSK